MRNLRFGSNVAALVVALNVSLLVGCATNQYRRTKTLSSEEYRYLYPRQYFNSLDPLERREVEDQMRQEDWRNEGKR